MRWTKEENYKKRSKRKVTVLVPPMGLCQKRRKLEEGDLRRLVPSSLTASPMSNPQKKSLFKIPPSKCGEMERETLASRFSRAGANLWPLLTNSHTWFSEQARSTDVSLPKEPR